MEDCANVVAEAKAASSCGHIRHRHTDEKSRVRCSPDGAEHREFDLASAFGVILKETTFFDGFSRWRGSWSYTPTLCIVPTPSGVHLFVVNAQCLIVLLGNLVICH
jgi:hypothetical protein